MRSLVHLIGSCKGPACIAHPYPFLSVSVTQSSIESHYYIALGHAALGWVTLLHRVSLHRVTSHQVTLHCIGLHCIGTFSYIGSHSIGTSVTAHLGPIRFIYFYRCIYLRGLTELGIPSGCWRKYFLQNYTWRFSRTLIV